MKNYIKILLLFLTISACGQIVTEMKTPKNAKIKFADFIAKKKFIQEPYPNFYPRIADKINKVAIDFRMVAESDNPTNVKYYEKIRIGLLRFTDIYIELDTEDRERICSYFEELMDIVELESSNGLLNNFMYGFNPNED